MFCPQCSQKQVTDEVSFCKSCGFPLADVAEALKNNGLVNRHVIPVTRHLKKGAIKGIVVMSLSGIFFILSLILGTPEPSYFVQFNMLVGILFYLFGLILIAHSFWGKSKEMKRYTDEKGRHVDFSKFQELDEHHQPANYQLNEPDSSELAEASGVRPARNPETRDLVERPSSVTEGTTKLLKNDL